MDKQTNTKTSTSHLPKTQVEDMLILILILNPRPRSRLFQGLADDHDPDLYPDPFPDPNPYLDPGPNLPTQVKDLPRKGGWAAEGPAGQLSGGGDFLFDLIKLLVKQHSSNEMTYASRRGRGRPLEHRSAQLLMILIRWRATLTKPFCSSWLLMC